MLTELIVPFPALEFWASVKNAVIHCWSVADWFVFSQLASPPNNKFSAVVTAPSLESTCCKSAMSPLIPRLAPWPDAVAKMPARSAST